MLTRSVKGVRNICIHKGRKWKPREDNAGLLLIDICTHKGRRWKPRKNNAGLLLIDMQYSFLSFVSETEGDRIVENQRRALDYFRSNEMPIYVVEYECYGLTDERLDVGDEEHVLKNHADAFYKTDLKDRLNNRGVEGVLLAGLYASACVARTGLGAIFNGFGVMVSGDLVADPTNQTYGSKWLKKHAIEKATKIC